LFNCFVDSTRAPIHVRDWGLRWGATWILATAVWIRGGHFLKTRRAFPRFSLMCIRLDWADGIPCLRINLIWIRLITGHWSRWGSDRLDILIDVSYSWLRWVPFGINFLASDWTFLFFCEWDAKELFPFDNLKVIICHIICLTQICYPWTIFSDHDCSERTMILENNITKFIMIMSWKELSRSFFIRLYYQWLMVTFMV
jgi:hypothetical protein